MVGVIFVLIQSFKKIVHCIHNHIADAIGTGVNVFYQPIFNSLLHIMCFLIDDSVTVGYSGKIKNAPEKKI